jgi:nucleotide-binding universal stress UspA family protein
MEVSLDQAIEIHAKVLKYRSGRHAARKARERAEELARAGDHEGHLVWIRVEETVVALIRDEGQS